MNGGLDTHTGVRLTGCRRLPSIMKHRARLFLFVALCFATLCSSAEARRKHHHHGDGPEPSEAAPAPEPAAWPIENAPKIDPAAPPSQSLQGLVDKHLVGVLAPLGDSAFDQPEFVSSYKAAYSDGLAAAPANHKAAYQLAIAICDNMSGAMTERQNAVSALRGALTTHSSEADQPKGGRAVGQQEAHEDNNFFLGTLKNNWVQRAAVLRNDITALSVRERDAERQVAPWTPPTPPPAPVAVTAAPTATPSVLAPAPSTDPLVGRWTRQGEPVAFGVDGTISGAKHGHWVYTCTTSSGRNYEFKYQHKGWADYLVLSPDGKTLDGKNQAGAHITASR